MTELEHYAVYHFQCVGRVDAFDIKNTKCAAP